MVSFGSPHVLKAHMWALNTCGEPNEIELTGQAHRARIFLPLFFFLGRRSLFVHRPLHHGDRDRLLLGGRGEASRLSSVVCRLFVVCRGHWAAAAWACQPQRRAAPICGCCCCPCWCCCSRCCCPPFPTGRWGVGALGRRKNVETVLVTDARCCLRL